MKIKYSEKLKQKWNYLFIKWLKDFYYKLDWRKPTPSSVKKFLQQEAEIAMILVEQKVLPKFTGTQDEKMLKILKWVIANFTYLPDIKSRFNTVDKWQTVLESLEEMTGDCEDGAILIHSLAIANGISSTSIELQAGNVLINNKLEGHAYILYYPDEFYNYEKDYGVPFTIDWCYWPDVSSFKNRIDIDRNKYKKKWFNIGII